MSRLIISAPFGNWFHGEQVFHTVGTFTYLPRPGRWKQFLKTVRPVRNGWRNKLGLRNPGLSFTPYGQISFQPNQVDSETIISIHGFNIDEWFALIHTLSLAQPNRDTLIELNVSCGNVKDTMTDDDYQDVFALVVKRFPRVIVKLGPREYWDKFQRAYHVGIKNFHLTNSMPGDNGSYSGKRLKPYSLEAVMWVRAIHPDVTIIGGGGITSEADMNDYVTTGADYFALGSFFLNPLNWRKLRALRDHSESLDAAYTLRSL